MEPVHISDNASTYRLDDPTSPDCVINTALRILMGRMSRESLIPLSDPSTVTKYLQLKLAPADREYFHVLFLDTRHRLIAEETLFYGTIDGAEVHPRVVVQRALAHNAAAIILAHNHPSQNAEPSAADRAVTVRLKQALSLVDIRLLDHFVVTCSQCTSLASRGWV